MRLNQRGQTFFVIDYETTGLDPVKDDPIEVGIIVTDERFNAIDTFNWLIFPRGSDTPKWGGSELYAYKVHGIHPDEFQNALQPCVVGEAILKLAKRHTSKQGQKPVLVSDNIQFEWAFTKKLIPGDWPFHYCGWDSSLLLEATGVGDPKPVHRAFADAGLLHAAILKALDRIQK